MPNQVQHTKRNSTIGYFGAFIILGISMAILGPSLPHLAENTSVKISVISSLFVARSAGYMLGSWVAGHLFDRFSGHRLLTITLLLMVVLLVSIPSQSLLLVLTAVLFLLGATEGSLDVGGNALLIWVHRVGVGPYMNALHSFFGVGAFLTPIFIAQALQVSGDIALGYWWLVLLAIPVAFWVVRLPSPEPLSDTKGDDYLDGDKPSFMPILAIVFYLFLYVGVEIGFGGWVYSYALEMGLANKSSAAYLTSAFWGAFTLSRFLNIWVATHLRPRTMLIADMVGCLLSVGIILLWPHSSIALWAGTIGLGISIASIFPTTINLAERRFTLTGKVTSWFFIGSGFGGMFFPWLMGQFFDKAGPQTTMFIILANLILATVIIFGVAAQPHKEIY